MGLRLASEETVHLDLGEDSFVNVAKDISKKEFNIIASRMDELNGEEDLSFAQAIGLTELLFEIFVRGWSLDVPPTLENYHKLESEGANALDGAIMKYFNKLTVTDDEAKKPETSPETSQKGTGRTKQ
jgi:hypothetical protein